MIVKRINQRKHDSYIEKILNDQAVFVMVVPKDSLWTYRSISFDDTKKQNIFMEFCISPRNLNAYNILESNKTKYEIYEKLPAWPACKKYDNCQNLRGLTSDKLSFLEYSLMQTDVTIISPDDLEIQREDDVGPIYIVTKDKKLFTNLKMYL